VENSGYLPAHRLVEVDPGEARGLAMSVITLETGGPPDVAEHQLKQLGISRPRRAALDRDNVSFVSKVSAASHRVCLCTPCSYASLCASRSPYMTHKLSNNS